MTRRDYQRIWMREKRRKTPKQLNAHIRAWKLSQSMVRLWSEGTIVPNGHKHTAESRSKLSAALSGKKKNFTYKHREWSSNRARTVLLPMVHTDAIRKKISETAKTSQNVKKALNLARDAARKSPKCQPLETNACAKELWIKSPDGITYHATNAQYFVRTHKALFNDADTIERGATRVSRAAHGLRLLDPKLKSGYPIWKGWTWDFIGQRNHSQEVLAL